MVIAETVCGRQTIWATHIGQLGDNAPDCFMYFVHMFFLFWEKLHKKKGRLPSRGVAKLHNYGSFSP